MGAQNGRLAQAIEDELPGGHRVFWRNLPETHPRATVSKMSGQMASKGHYVANCSG